MVHYKKRVDFSSDRLMFYYSGIYESDFIFTDGNELCMLNFGDTGYMPESFMSFALHRAAKSLACAIGSKIILQKSANLDAMGMASYLLNVASNSRLGKHNGVSFGFVILTLLQAYDNRNLVREGHWLPGAPFNDGIYLTFELNFHSGKTTICALANHSCSLHNIQLR